MRFPTSKQNGAAYFSGSSIFQFGEADIANVEDATSTYPVAVVGKNIGIYGASTAITLYDDFSENILFFGANKQGQTTGVLMNAFISLIYSYRKLGRSCDFIVIDCLTNESSGYKSVLAYLEEQGMCHIVDRKKSGRTLSAIVEDVKNGCARPVVLAIIGNERYIEMKRDLPLRDQHADTMINEDSFSSDSIEPLSFDLQLDDLSEVSSVTPSSKRTFQQALTYLLEEGPNQGVHILLQVDKPANILFKGDYDVIFTWDSTNLRQEENLQLQVVEQVKRFFGDKVYKTTVPRNVRLSEAPSYGQPINFYDPSSKGCEAYMDMAREFLRNQRL